MQNSSTFNFKQNRKNFARILGLFFGAVLCFFGGVRLLVERVDSLHFAAPLHESISRDRPVSEISTLGWGDGDNDHAALFFDENRIMTGIVRKADILILGNSRTQFAFPADRLRTFSQLSGHSIYNLSVGYNEAGRYFLELIRKFDLRPKTVIINIDGFFHDQLSDYATEVLGDGAWAAKRLSLERTLSYWIYPSLAQALPNFSVGRTNYLVYRDTNTGAWIPQHFPAERTPVLNAIVPVSPSHFESPFLETFLTEMKERQIRVLFTWIPGPHASYLRGFAKKCGVRAINPPSLALFTFDKVHLDPDSGRIFAAAFFSELQNDARF
jgi:hypothetical protein